MASYFYGFSAENFSIISPRPHLRTFIFRTRPTSKSFYHQIMPSYSKSGEPNPNTLKGATTLWYSSTLHHAYSAHGDTRLDMTKCRKSTFLPITPPSKKNIVCKIARHPKMTNNFLLLKFSTTAPIFGDESVESVFKSAMAL